LRWKLNERGKDRQIGDTGKAGSLPPFSRKNVTPEWSVAFTFFHSKAIIKVVDDLVKGMLGAWDGGASEPFLLVFACPSVWIQESHGALKLWLAISMVSCVILSIMAAEKYCHCAVIG
jgi:hypothetical protein